MFFYSIKRALLMVPILLGITLLSFSVMHMAPGGPAEAQMEFSAKASAEAPGTPPEALRSGPRCTSSTSRGSRSS